MNICGAPEVTEITVIKVLQGLSSNCEVRVKAMIACLFISVGGASCIKIFHGYRPAFVGCCSVVVVVVQSGVFCLMLKLLSLSLFLSLSLSLSLSFVVSVRSFCFQSLSPSPSTSSCSSSFLLFPPCVFLFFFQCLCMCHLCAMSIKVFFSVGTFETQTHCFAENCTCSDVGPEARQQNYNCLTSYRDDLEKEPWMKVANRANFRPNGQETTGDGREERKTCEDEEGACIELESLDSLLVSIGNFRLEKTGIIGWYEISGL